jgi:hypothetical protein
VSIIYQIVGFGFFLGLMIWQGAALLHQTLDKNKKYEAASAVAAEAGKPLLVIGGPMGITWLRRFSKMMAHGYGDVCMDIDPRALRGCPSSVLADIRHIPFTDKTFGAVFVSHVLEHLPNTGDARKAVSELNRVADAVFIAYPHKHYIVSWLIPDHHLWVWQKDGRTYLKQRKNRQKKDFKSAG